MTLDNEKKTIKIKLRQSMKINKTIPLTLKNKKKPLKLLWYRSFSISKKESTFNSLTVEETETNLLSSIT